MGLEREDLLDNPIEQFAVWLEEAKSRSGMSYPNAACLSTVSPDGMPEGRIVLLRNFDELGFSFYTNLESAKGRALVTLPKAAMTFYWDELQRQIRIQGVVCRVSDKDADAYFASRPRNSQIGAWASEQSRVMKDREVLESRCRFYEQRFEGTHIPRPPHWSGFTISPLRMEFWQERDFRLHDRFAYARATEADKWLVDRLSP